MGPLLPPWKVARFDQIDAAVRELIFRLDLPVGLPPGLDLPDDPFTTAEAPERTAFRRRAAGPLPFDGGRPADPPRSPLEQGDQAGSESGGDAAAAR